MLSENQQALAEGLDKVLRLLGSDGGSGGVAKKHRDSDIRDFARQFCRAGEMTDNAAVLILAKGFWDYLDSRGRFK